MSLVERIEAEQQRLKRMEERKEERVRKKAKRPQYGRSEQKRKKQIAQHETYADYLNTVWWKKRSYEFREKYPTCYVCGSGENLHTHHIRYQRGGESVLYRERDADLRTACETCHKKAHHYSMERIFRATGPKFKELKYIFLRLPVPSKVRVKDKEIVYGPLPPGISISRLMGAPRMPSRTKRRLEIALKLSADNIPNFESKLNEGFERTNNPRILIRKNQERVE